ncbi:nucleotidyltransferase family protein [Sandaracinus amylolyticus]|uniref:CTP molybdopterin cytidylyltransferase n=1 Tax=Sandaracinus amylolyticus TaxID=927083 RepID=A0A0F6W4L4_9BACT|nr:nucleotidyltransferase family protein [Sandaracinus amylolyticus]AKF07183.1 CTP molybdopterin cytidylyltransferase [Sandaracinus amylolyticus]
MSDVAGIVLAAGRSARAGRVKALDTLDGETWIARAVRAQRDAGVERVLVVLGEPHAARIARALPEGVRWVRNPAPARGMLSSLQVALAASDAERVVVSLIDHPRVRASTVRGLIAALDAGALVARPRFGGRRGHPYAIAGDAIRALREAPLDRSARDVLLGIVPALDVEVDDPGVLDDLDHLGRSSLG